MSIRRSFLYALTGQQMQLEEQLKARPVSKYGLKSLISLASSLGHNHIVRFLQEEGHKFLKADAYEDYVVEAFDSGRLPLDKKQFEKENKS
jgi:hypothetical protein